MFLSISPTHSYTYTTMCGSTRTKRVAALYAHVNILLSLIFTYYLSTRYYSHLSLSFPFFCVLYALNVIFFIQSLHLLPFTNTTQMQHFSTLSTDSRVHISSILYSYCFVYFLFFVYLSIQSVAGRICLVFVCGESTGVDVFPFAFFVHRKKINKNTRRKTT